jgi:tetratricopeptide (TPR) repeat protein
MDARNEEVYKSYDVDARVEEDFFVVTDSISRLIQHFLEIKSLQKNQSFDVTRVYTRSPEAYKLYLQGYSCIGKLDYTCGIDCLSGALSIDSNFVTAMRSLAYAYGDVGQLDKCREWAYKAYRNLDRVPHDVQLTIKEIRAAVDKQPYDLINVTRQYLELYPNSIAKQYTLGWAYYSTGQWKKAISAFQNSIEIADKFEMTAWVWTYILLARSCHEIGDHVKEGSVLEEANRRIPRETAEINYWQAVCAVSCGDSLKAGVHMNHIRNYGVENNWPESRILNWEARIYTQARVPDKAEELHRQALALDPDHPKLMNDLASFLVAHDKNREEARVLMEQVLEQVPENPDYLFTYGRVLNVSGLHKEAFQVLKKSWDLRPYYEHDHYLLLTELEESLTNQI